MSIGEIAPSPCPGSPKRQSLHMTHLAALPDRAVLAIEGDDRVAFLQGLVSNDVAEVAPGRAVWAALLTPQGKWLADFFISSDGERLLLDCERDQAAMVLQRLSRFRLRSKVTLRIADGIGGPRRLGRHADRAPAIAAPDPRLPEAGWRVLCPDTAAHHRDVEADWDRHRLALGLPDGSRDLEAEKIRAAGGRLRRAARRVLEQGLLHGPGADRADQVSRAGQAPAGAGRDRGPAAAAPARRCCATGRRSAPCGRDARQHGLAVLRLDALEGSLTCGGAVLAPRRPAWMRAD